MLERLQDKLLVLERRVSEVRSRLELAEEVASAATYFLALDSQRIDTREARRALALALARWECDKDAAPAEEASHA